MTTPHYDTHPCPYCDGKGGVMDWGRWQPCEREGCYGTGVLVWSAPTDAATITRLADALRELSSEDRSCVGPGLCDDAHEALAVAATAIEALREQVWQLQAQLAAARALAEPTADELLDALDELDAADQRAEEEAGDCAGIEVAS